MSCSQNERLIQAYIDQTITEEEKNELNDHLTVCPSCRQELQDMIEVISFVEDIGETRLKKVKQRSNRFKTSLFTMCMTVCSAAVLVFYNPMNGLPFPAEQRVSLQYRHIVLADENEQLPLPEQYELMTSEKKRKNDFISILSKNRGHSNDDSLDITWVYPSVYSQIQEVDIDELSDEYVFVNIPDEETLYRLRRFLQREDLFIPIEVSQFPVSIVIYRNNEKPWVQEFEFPAEMEQIHQLVENTAHLH